MILELIGQPKQLSEIRIRTAVGEVGVLYHDLILPGESMHRETGAVHFTIKVRQWTLFTKAFNL